MWGSQVSLTSGMTCRHLRNWSSSRMKRTGELAAQIRRCRGAAAAEVQARAADCPRWSSRLD